MIYLTYNDQPSGIYNSQVIDVCNFVNSSFKCRLRLVTLISFRGFWKNREKIKAKLPDAIVLPMFPKHKNWRLNKFILKLLFLIIGKQNIWARGIFAANIALDLKAKGFVKKVVFDARGAYKAEFEEYLHKIVHLDEDIYKLEERAILNSDFKLGVSKSLVDYWRSAYHYSSLDYVVIPCTQNVDMIEKIIPDEQKNKLSNELGLKPEDVVLVYSGSAADWQSINLVDDFIMKVFSVNENVKLLLLSKVDTSELKIVKQFPQRIIQCWVDPGEVLGYLSLCDYGILIREDSVTNQVASPTKFAEYLNAGLKVLISEKVGDFSKFVKDNNCGFVYSEQSEFFDLKKADDIQKSENKKIASLYFSKKTYLQEYQKIINVLS